MSLGAGNIGRAENTEEEETEHAQGVESIMIWVQRDS